MTQQVSQPTGRTDDRPSRTSASREQLITAHAIEMLFRRLSGSQAHLFIMPAVIVYGWWNYVSHAVLVIWAIVTCTVYIARILIANQFNRLRPELDEVLRWGHYFTITSVFSGLAWGVAGVLFFVPGSAGHQLLLYTSIMGLAVGSLVVTLYWFPGFFAFAIPAMVMSAARLAYEGTFEYQGLAVLLLMYLSVITIVGRSQRVAAYETIQLRYENVELIEKLRQQKDVAEQANVAKSRFLAAASHDLRQPLHALGLFVATLSEQIRFPGVRVLVDNIGQSVAALEGLFNALLDISRLDAGVVQPKFIHINLDNLLQRMDSEYAPQVRQRQLVWRLECDTHAAVRTDPALLETIIRNLVSNAIRYTSHGSVSLRGVLQGKEFCIEVEDTGVGIPVEQQQDVFREFVQLQNPERDRRKGLGLGLAIVHRLAGLLGHRLVLQSVPGLGTTFRLYLPLAEQDAVLEPAEVAPTSAGEEDGMSVLVVDDEASVRDAMQMLLGNWGHMVIVAGSEDEALQLLEARRVAPDAIVVDYRLREERTGVEVIRAVHRRWGAHIPALIVTGDTAPDRLREVNESGFMLLHKPVKPGRLRAFLRQASLRNSRKATVN